MFYYLCCDREEEKIMDYKIIYDGEEEKFETTEIDVALNEIRVFAENMEFEDRETVVITLNALY